MPRFLFPFVCALALAAAPLAGQQQAQELIRQRTGQNVSTQQILERLQASGLSRSQVRSRLQQAGYDPSLADPYFDRLEAGGAAQGATPLSAPSSEFMSALQEIGIAVPGVEPTPGSGPAQEQAIQEALATPSGGAGGNSGGGLPVFGRDVFSRPTSQFAAITSGPVDPGYRLGPDDQIILVLTGDVELAYTLTVSREGFLVIPDVGQVSVNGLTLAQLQDRLYDRLGAVYSGVNRNESQATTHFNVSLGELRRNLVYFIGEVEEPGAYQISSVATVFNGLHRAGGPSERGSFRKITIRRGGQVARQVDIYDYLLDGDTRNDIRLEQGDIVYVPLAGPMVTVRGQVRRPAQYELKADEDLRDAIRFAGGLAPDAFVQRIQVDRILPPEERRPGHERVLIDVDLSSLDEQAEPFALKDGDVVRVFGVSEERRNRVAIQGRVWRPGVYEFRPGMTVWNLIDRADGLMPEAFPAVAHVFRLNLEDQTLELRRVSLRRDESGQPEQDLALADLDSVVVYGRDELLNPREVSILGAVKEPGTYTLAEDMTVEDLILAAGGFKKGALGLEAEVMRIEAGVERSDTLARSYRVALGGELPSDLGRRSDDGAVSSLTAGELTPADRFMLEDQDRVFVRQRPGYSPPATVQVSGNVLYPGSYGLTSRDERLSSVIERAGGLTDEAYAEGFRLVRDSVPVGVDLEQALAHPGGEEDVVLRDGDGLVVPAFEATVLVRGAVAFESRILYQDGMSLDDFLAQAGGTTSEADRGRISVQYASGARDVVKERSLFFDHKPSVQPGSTIYVPTKPESGEGFDWGTFISRTVSVVSTAATVAIAVTRF